jgi:hypothetical protein
VPNSVKTEHTKWFEQTAFDPDRRRAAIADLTKRRNIVFCCALVVTGCAFAMFLSHNANPKSPIVESFAAFMLWIPVIRWNSDLRVLKLLEQFPGRDNKSSS